MRIAHGVQNVNYRRALNIEDLRQLARRRLPRVAYEFLDGGTEDDVTLRENRAAFGRFRFQPRVLVDVSKRSQKVTLWDQNFNLPFGIAPTGAAGLYCFEADIALARAAAAAGVPFVLSTASFVPLERVLREAGGTQWFQLYMSKDRALAERLVTRARDAGFEALVVTTDIPVAAAREYNRRNNFEVPFRLNLANMVDGALHPGWLLNVFLRTLLDSGVPRFQNLDVNVGGRIISKSLTEFRTRRDALNWSDIRWLREIWPRRLLVKGILTVEDAQCAADSGADGIFVSNHGGRQLDGAPSPLEVLPQIVNAMGQRLAIMVDGGFRRGSDIVKALALGADMVFLGRAPLYGAAAGGEEGVLHALNLLRSEVDRVMALIGCPTVDGLGPEYLRLETGRSPHARDAAERADAAFWDGF
ncbi:MAG: alpha-hydroxy-acid oxidizing protein [Betaproteobacteria bacterium]|nr:alpha-hydroxy-acid oxidizing protein [Betaproteobacteria bacterium]